MNGSPRRETPQTDLAGEHGDRPMLSVVVPCYNEADGIAEFHRRTLAACMALGETFEIVYVNDGSRDATLDRLTALCQPDVGTRVCAVNLSRNHGHQLALTAGLTVARGDRIFILDADLQDPPELLEKMWRKMDGESLDVVYGKRKHRQGETAFKLFTAAAFYRFIGAMTSTPIPRDTGDFRLMSRRAVDALLAMPERHRFIRGMVSWVGFGQAPYEYDRDARFAGETNYPLHKMIAFATDAITSFSIKPLRLATYVGFVFAGAVAPLLLVYAVASWLIFGAEPGWPSLLCAVTLLGGIQLLVLGIIGEYLGRVYEQVKGRPLFFIADIICQPHANPRTAATEPKDEVAS